MDSIYTFDVLLGFLIGSFSTVIAYCLTMFMSSIKSRSEAALLLAKMIESQRRLTKDGENQERD